jgi:DNA-binding response OmpR family regulator
VFRRGELLDRVWGTDFEGVDRVVDVHISNLRQRLETDPSQPKLILTVRGVGYKFAGEMT